MKKQSILLAIAILLSTCSWAGAYSGGTGEPNDPYQIATAEDMNEIGTNPDDWDAHFLLVADINLAQFTGAQFNIIGNDGVNAFTGVFDGNGHTISSFTYECTDISGIGLFGYLDDPNAEIKDLTLIDPNVHIAGNSGYVGCLVGRSGNGTITNCGVEACVLSGWGDSTGGLVGWNQFCTISSCYAAGSVSGHNSIGGLVGQNRDGAISNCYVTGSVSGVGSTGGMVGWNDIGTISNCYATASVSGVGNWTGGLVGNIFEGEISNCYATGSVSGSYGSGGLVGGSSAGSTISNCYATGGVTGGQRAAGLVGDNSSTISNCYAEGTVWGGGYEIGGLIGTNANGATISNCYATGSVWGFYNAGGLVAVNHGTISNCYATGAVSAEYAGGLVDNNYEGMVLASFWDIETTGLPWSDGGEGKTTAEMKQRSTFTGWDFVETWGIEDNQTYPFLRLKYPVGDLDLDKDVDFLDFAHFANHWLAGVE